MCEKSHVEVGCLEKCNQPWLLESRFFPSKVGGKPAWLNLKDISVDVSCEVCLKPCIFLCQVHAPITDNENSYLRTIFVFVCKNPECCGSNCNKNFKVFRCQLPRVNDFYVPEEPDDTAEWHPECSIDKYHKLCQVCGCLGSYQCGKCKSVKYCSKEHQVLGWKLGHNKDCGTNSISYTVNNIIFPEYEMFIEPEFCDDDSETELEGKVQKSEEELLSEYKNLIETGKGGTLQDIPEEVLENFASVKEDKFLKHFKERLKVCPNQVVRYDRGGEPLWIAAPNLKEDDIPNCDICSGPRKFEFQILPTLLSYLEVDSLEKSLDWGSLMVYTCAKSCDDGPAYKKEFIWKQDIS